MAQAIAWGHGAITPASTPASTPVRARTSARGTLAVNPPRPTASLTAATVAADLSAIRGGTPLLRLAGQPVCGVDVYSLQYWTVGGAHEATESSGALMVPTGTAPACSGPRPIVLYAHGTDVDKRTNLADITNPSDTEGVLIATLFAAQGYIVVAPNYAGYDISTLGYHPYLDAAQQSDEMIDTLAAARTALSGALGARVRDDGQLFVTGYSEGGYVAMATLRALERNRRKVTAAAPLSGPYALEALADAVFFGHVDLGSTLFAPLLTTSYQHEYGDIYETPADIYSPAYAGGIETLLPSTTPLATLFRQNKLPQTALFDRTVPKAANPELQRLLNVPRGNPLFAIGFGEPALINNAFRLAYATDAFNDPDGAVLLGTAALAAREPSLPLRRALYLNDMRYGSWAPSHPLLMCGGDRDPTVFFSLDTGTMAAFWRRLPAGLIHVLDVDAPPAGPFSAVQTAFQNGQARQLAYLESTAGGGLSAAAARERLLLGYHVAVEPFCMLAARAFFARFVPASSRPVRRQRQ